MIGYDGVKKDHLDILLSATEVLTEMFVDDIHTMSETKNYDAENLFMISFLPRKHILRYDFRFLVQFFNSFLVVCYKLEDKRFKWKLSTVAEEMAMNAIIEQAKIMDENLDLDYVYDLIFEDTDFESLFDLSEDGLLDSDNIVSQLLNPVNLKFDEWFIPFDGFMVD